MHPLQMRDQAVIGRRRHRVAADQQRMEAEGDAQLRIGEIVAHLAEHRAIALQADHGGRRAQQGADAVEGLVRQLAEGDAVDRLAVPHEAFEAGQVLWRDARDLRAGGVEIGAAGHHRAVVEADAVEGIHRPQLHVVRHASAAQRPQFLEQIGRGDDGGAGIEGEAVLPEDIGTAAGRIELLHDRHAPAARAEPHRGGETAEAGADHHGMGTRIAHGIEHVGSPGWWSPNVRRSPAWPAPAGRSGRSWRWRRAARRSRRARAAPRR